MSDNKTTYQGKTKEELIKMLQNLQEENRSLKDLHEKDITNCKQKNKFLQNTHQNYESFFNTITDFIFVLDEQANIIHVNTIVIERLGYKKEELIGNSVLMIHPPDRKDEAKSIVGKMLNGDLDSCPVPVFTKSGKQIPVETKIKKGTWNNRQAIFGISRDISQILLSEEERRKSDERFRIAQEISPDGFTIFKPVRDEQNRIIDFIWVYQNAAVAKMNGTSPQKVVGESFLKLFPGMKGTKFWNAYIKVAESGTSMTFEDAYIGETMKTKKWFHINVVPTGEDIAILSHEITEQKIAEKALQESENNLRFINNMTNEALEMQDIKSIYNYISSSLQKLLPNTVILFLSVDHSRNISTLENVYGIKNHLLEKALSILGINPVGKPFTLMPEYVELHKTGKLVEFKNGLVDFSYNQLPAIAMKSIEKIIGIHKIYTIGISKDNVLFAGVHFLTFNQQEIINADFIESFVKQAGMILQVKQAEQELGESEEKYRLITENASDVIWVLNLSKEALTYVSPSVFGLSGYTPEEAIKKDINQFLTPESERLVNNKIKETLPLFLANPEKTSNKSHHIQLKQLRKDGSSIWVDMTLSYVLNSNNEVEIIGISRNIEESMEAKEQLERLNKELEKQNQDKDKFMSILAHDMRNPFNSLIGFSDLLAENIRDFDMDEIETYVKKINNAAHKNFNILEDVMEWSLARSNKKTYSPSKILLFEICQYLIEEENNQAKRKNILLQCKVSPGIYIHSDKKMMRTILRNLISNAIKFTPNKGSITIDAKENKNEIVVSVADTGVGIKKANLSELFNIGNNISTTGTENEQGTGLGLQICKEFVEKMGGEIWAESKVGKGSVFYFTVPKQEDIK